MIRPSFSDEGTFSCFSVRARGKPWKQMIDVYENWGLNRPKNPSKARISGNRCNGFLSDFVEITSCVYTKKIILFNLGE